MSSVFSGCQGLQLPFFSSGEETPEGGSNGGKEIAMIESPPDIPPCPPPRPNLPVEPAMDGDLPVTPSGLDSAELAPEEPSQTPEAQAPSSSQAPVTGQSGAPVSNIKTGERLPSQSERLPTLPKNPKPSTSPRKSSSVEIKPGGLDAPPRPTEAGGSQSTMKGSPVRTTVDKAPPAKPPVDLGPVAQPVPKKKPIANDDPLEPKLEPIIFDEGEDKDDEGGYVKVETLQKPGKTQRIETRTTP